MRITIAICTWNRCALLRQTLEQLTRLVVPPATSWELLVINNNCTDETEAVIEAFSSVLPVRGVFEPAPGLSNARNRAIEESAGDYIIWIDDDVLVDERWLLAFVDIVKRHPSVAAVGGPIVPWFPVDPDPVFLDAFPFLKNGFCGLNHGPQEKLLERHQDIFGANMGFARAAIGSLRFDPHLGPTGGSVVVGDETEFVSRLRGRGGQVMWSPAMRVRHYVDPSRMTLDYLLRYYEDRGRTLIRLSDVHQHVHLFGVPRWIVRLLVQEYARYCVLRFTPFRRQALSSLGEYRRLRGMAIESRARHREGRSSGRGDFQARGGDVAA